MKRLNPEWNSLQWGCALMVLLAVSPFVLVFVMVFDEGDVSTVNHGPLSVGNSLNTNVVLWNGFPESVEATKQATGSTSNIHPEDYVGPESCQQCHEENYESWSRHPHRWMNTLASPETVKGNFSSQSGISYRGGSVRFSSDDGQFRMHLSRDGIERVYLVTQTIGSRFMQNYVGRLESGPEPAGHPFYRDEHVLPFAYWLTEKEWAPVVNVVHERPDFQRVDPFHPPEHERDGYAVYARNCNYCHTTFPLSDMLLRDPDLIGMHAPRQLNWDATSYIRAHHPDLWATVTPPNRKDPFSLEQLIRGTRNFEAKEKAVTLGISCEACHLGCRAHTHHESTPPRFFPSSPHLLTEDTGEDLEVGRTHTNVNWICGRCHTGRDRPYYAAGMATWNSIEYADALQGGCYSELTCITCHNPHKAIGHEWTRTQAEDDRTCLNCHSEYEPEPQRVEHTHHPISSPGSGCMNCHMPRINQGLGGIVRTHTIFSPTQRDMIEANHPNACNLCHTDQPLRWTLAHLADWYGAKFSDDAIAQTDPDPEMPIALGWLNSDNEAVRLVAADALARSKGADALSHLLDALDDPYLINRQFARRQIERILGVHLEGFGYRFYMTPSERAAPLEEMRRRLLPP